jgi:hypothetical protein
MSTNHTEALLRFVRRWFDERTVTSVFEPLLADHQREWLDAAPSARLRIAMRTAAVLIVSIARLAPRALVLTPTPPSMTRRVLARIIIFTAAAATLLTVPIWLELRQLTLPQKAVAAFWLLPAGVALAFPFAMTWVADAIRRHIRPTPMERIAAFRVGMMAVLFTILVVGWVVPTANQQFREIAAPADARPPARGVRELTTRDLIVDPSGATADAPFTRNGQRGAIRRELNTRAVMALLPALLLWLRWGALERPRKAWFSPLPVSLATAITICGFYFSYFASMAIEHRANWEPGTALWLPLIALGMWGTAERWWSRRLNQSHEECSNASTA